MISETMNLKLKVWRQDNAEDDGRFEHFEALDISPNTVSYTHLTLPTKA